MMALREAGRPVLVIPFAEVFPTVGTRVMLAWNGRREATRALRDSILLIAGAQVSILNVQTTSNEMRADATPCSHAAWTLMRYGVAVEVEHGTGGSDLTIGELLLSPRQI